MAEVAWVCRMVVIPVLCATGTGAMIAGSDDALDIVLNSVAIVVRRSPWSVVGALLARGDNERPRLLVGFLIRPYPQRHAL